MEKAIKFVRKNLDDAEQMAKELMEDILAPYGIDGVALNTHCEDCYAVVSEINPRDFKVVDSVRCYEGNLEMQLCGEDKWRILAFVDIPFLLDELCYALDYNV